MDAYLRGGDSRWTAQFGLYRYQSTDPRQKGNRKMATLLCGFLGMIAIAIFLTSFFIIYENNTSQSSIPISTIVSDFPDEQDGYNEDPLNVKNYNFNDAKFPHERDSHIESSNKLNRSSNNNINNNGTDDNDYDDDFDDHDSENSTMMHTTILTMTDNGVSEKLVFPPSQHLKPPKYHRRRRKNMNRRQFNPRMSYYEPRPFDFPLNGPKPSSFQKNSTPPPLVPVMNGKKVNSIQDILNQGEMIHSDQPDSLTQLATHSGPGNRIAIVGTYRHPKEYGDVIRTLKRTPTPTYDLIPSASSSPQSTFSPSSSSSTATTFKGDLFYNYKPSAPSDVNLLALNQFRFAPPQNPNIPTIRPGHKNQFIPMFPPTPYKYPHPLQNHVTNSRPHSGNDAESLYQEIVNSSRGAEESIGEIMRIGNGGASPASKKKPFSLMLDIYPMADDEPTTRRPRHNNRPIEFQPLPNHSAINNMQMIHPHDHSYFNTMHFPQIQPNRFPQPNQYNYNPVQYPHHHRHGVGVGSEKNGQTDKPGQMVVHLNLYPKNRRNKHRSVEILEERSIENGGEPVSESVGRSNEFLMEPQEMTEMPTEQLNTGEVVTTNLNTGEVYSTPTMTEFETQLMRLPTPNVTNTTLINEIKSDDQFEIQRSVEIPTNISFENVDPSNYSTPFNVFSPNKSDSNYNDDVDEHHPQLKYLQRTKNNSNATDIPYLMITRSDINELISQKLAENGDSKYFNIDDDYAEDDSHIGQERVDSIIDPRTIELSDKIDGFDDDQSQTNGNHEMMDENNMNNFTVPDVQFVRFETKDGIRMPSERDIFSELNKNEKIPKV